MERFSGLLNKPEQLGPLLILLGLGPLGYALYSQQFLGLEPCELCLYQRVPFVVMAFAGFAVWGGIMVRKAVALGALAFAIGGAIAVYHVGVEQHWWASAVCDGGAQGAFTTQDLLAGLNQAAEKPCDQIDWTFLGLSMASWNVLYSFGLAVILMALVKRRGQHEQHA